MTPGRRELLILGAVAGAAVLAGGAAGVLALQSRSGAAQLLSSTYPDLSGRPRRLLEWQGRPLVCNFWASWCAPCREELPILDALQREMTPNFVQVVGIAVDTAANVQDFLKEVKVGFPVLIAGASAIELMRRLANRSGALPFTVMLDAAGRLRERRLGAYSADELRAGVQGLLR
jgi:thiol-disulfide isomerase/thioredoxin